LIHSLDGIKYMRRLHAPKKLTVLLETRFSKSHSYHQDHVGQTRASGRLLFLRIATISPDQKRIHRHKRTEIKKSDPEPKSKSEPESKPEEESEAIANR